MKNNIISLIASVVIGVTGYIGFQLYQAIKMVNQNHIDIVQIADYLNKQAKVEQAIK